MSQFRKAVNEAISQGMRGVTHPMRGVIPQDGVDLNDWTCTVQANLPKGGKQPGGSDVLTFHDVPLPHNADGIIQAFLSLVKNGPRAVTLGFKGGNMSFPYIINFESFLHQATDKNDKKVENKNPATPQKFTTAATPGTPATAPQSFIGPPAPFIGPPVPASVAGSATTAAKSGTASDQAAATFHTLLNRSTTVTVRSQ